MLVPGLEKTCLIHEPGLEEANKVHGHVERDGDEGVEQEGVVEELGEEQPRQAVRGAVEPEVVLGIVVLNEVKMTKSGRRRG